MLIGVMLCLGGSGLILGFWVWLEMSVGGGVGWMVLRKGRGMLGYLGGWIEVGWRMLGGK